MLPEKLHFSPLSRRLVEASFTGGHITSDAGLLLLREVDRQHGLTRRLWGFHAHLDTHSTNTWTV
ncbi:transposase, partial [Pseudomonas aeruginosa]